MRDAVLTTLLAGLAIGLTAGASPGPLLVLVVTATLRGGWRHGLVTAVAPLASDLIVVVVALATLGRLPTQWLSWLGVIGGVAVIAVGVQTVLESRRGDLGLSTGQPAPSLSTSFWRASMVNLLSPHPWISWITVLGPLTVTAWRSQPSAGVGFVTAFYVGLVGIKAVLGFLVASGRHRLNPSVYARIVFVAGIALIVLGVVMAVEFARQL
ncbi:MAG: LysE family translocator [Nostocoides sp.]